MEKLSNKKYNQYDYLCRYTGVPYYYDSEKKKEVCGIGEQLKKDIPYVSHKVTNEDTLDSLSLTYYNNPTF
jgi:hypothetical protein